MAERWRSVPANFESARTHTCARTRGWARGSCSSPLSSLTVLPLASCLISPVVTLSLHQYSAWKAVLCPLLSPHKSGPFLGTCVTGWIVCVCVWVEGESKRLVKSAFKSIESLVVRVKVFCECGCLSPGVYYPGISTKPTGSSSESAGLPICLTFPFFPGPLVLSKNE